MLGPARPCWSPFRVADAVTRAQGLIAGGSFRRGLQAVVYSSTPYNRWPARCRLPVTGGPAAAVIHDPCGCCSFVFRGTLASRPRVLFSPPIVLPRAQHSENDMAG